MQANEFRHHTDYSETDLLAFHELGSPRLVEYSDAPTPYEFTRFIDTNESFSQESYSKFDKGTLANTMNIVNEKRQVSKSSNVSNSTLSLKNFLHNKFANRLQITRQTKNNQSVQRTSSHKKMNSIRRSGRFVRNKTPGSRVQIVQQALKITSRKSSHSPYQNALIKRQEAAKPIRAIVNPNFVRFPVNINKNRLKSSKTTDRFVSEKTRGIYNCYKEESQRLMMNKSMKLNGKDVDGKTKSARNFGKLGEVLRTLRPSSPFRAQVAINN